MKASDSADEAECGERPEHDLLGEAATDARRQIDAAARNSSAKSRSDTASSELAIGRSKPSAFAVASRSMGSDVPASAAAPERAFVEPLPRIGEAAAVAAEHLDIGEQMMAEGDRLRRLQMGEARHDGRGMRRRLLRRARSCKRASSAVERVDRVAHIAGGSRSPPGRCASAPCAAGRPAGPISSVEPRLDIQMDVLERAREGEVAGLDLGRDLCRGRA